jgi:5-methylcytosine-specific restriction endonuclease McrA
MPTARPDRRSADAVIYRQWYGTARWQRRRLDQLRKEPFCAMCRRAGIWTAATVADHVQPHKGSATAFWTGQLQSLCKPHHDRDKQRAEMMDRPLTVDEQGWPHWRA